MNDEKSKILIEFDEENLSIEIHAKVDGNVHQLISEALINGLVGYFKDMVDEYCVTETKNDIDKDTLFNLLIDSAIQRLKGAQYDD